MKSKRELAAENAALRQRLSALAPDSRKGLRRMIETQKQQIKAHNDVLKERDTSIKKLGEDLDAAHALIKKIQGALDTAEVGENLVQVARDACTAERKLAAMEAKKEEAEPADDALAKAAQSLQDGKKGNGNGKKRSAKSST